MGPVGDFLERGIGKFGMIRWSEVPLVDFFLLGESSGKVVMLVPSVFF